MSRERKPLRSCATVLVLGAMAWVGCMAGPGSTSPLSEVRFESGIDRVAFEFSPSRDGVDVVGRDRRLLLRIEFDDDRVVIIDPTAGEVAAVTRLPTGAHRGYRLADANDVALRSEIRIEADGDLEVRDSNEAVLYKLKRRDYGFKIVDGNGESIARVRRSSGGKLSVRDESHLTYLQTRDPIPVEAVALIALPGLSFAEATGLAVAAWIWPEGGP
jgi:hypothetical protein